VPALIEALQDENPEVRMFVAVSLGILGPDAKAAVPDLVEMLEDKDKTAQAVEEIGTNGKSFLGKLFEIFTDQDDWIRSAVEWALEEMNTPEARKALEEYKQKSK
jgi:HEAT repeat protein